MVRASPSSAAAHSFAKNANEWGTRLSLIGDFLIGKHLVQVRLGHLQNLPEGALESRVFVGRFWFTLHAGCPTHSRSLRMCGRARRPTPQRGGWASPSSAWAGSLMLQSLEVPRKYLIPFSSQTLSEHHHRLPTARRRQWRSTCSRAEVCPSSSRSSKLPQPR